VLFVRKRLKTVIFVFSILPISFSAFAQSSGTAGSIDGKVTDPTGAVVVGAQVKIQNPVSGYSQTAVADSVGQFHFRNVPFNPYHLSVTAGGFASQAQDVSVRSSVPVTANVQLQLTGAQQTVTVEASAEDLIERDPTAHTDIDSSLIKTLPAESVSSGLSSIITLGTPSVTADSNGLFHPLGEHAETTFTIDGQPISDQQSRTFSNQVSSNTVQSMEVISGVPPAEFGDKASLTVRTVSKSGLGIPRMFGSISAGYASFGTSDGNISWGAGNEKFGNFISLDDTNSGRFLDSPEFRVLHDHGNDENIFDRFDYQASQSDSFHINLSAARSWFQTPNQFDQQTTGQDQRQQIKSFNIAPSYTHIFSPETLLSANAWVRQDRVGYYPSRNVFFDLPATLAQARRLTNAGIKSDISYVKGIHNFKAGVQFQHTFLSENFRTGLTDPAFNAVCLTTAGAPITDPAVLNPACTGFGQQVNPSFNPGLLPFDLTRGGSLFSFKGRTDIKEEAVYAQDTLTIKQFSLMLGLRGDNYNGLSHRNQIEPRLGLSYNLKASNTVLRIGYGRMFVTPFNENLILSSSTGQGGLATNVFGAFGARPLIPAKRNEFNTGFEQAFGKYLVVDGEYFWKYTNPDYDFDVVLNTSLTFPIQWRKSKIDGFGIRANFPQYHGFSAYSVLGHTRSRFFGPELGGILFNSPVSTNVFRIDHDQAFQQTTHVQYQYKPSYPWIEFNWRYDSGEVAGHLPFAADTTTPVDLTGLTGDQQAQIGLSCGGVFATLNSPLTSCAPSLLGSTRGRIPAPGTENDDRNPPRIAPRNLFDAGVGLDNIFHKDRYKTNLRFTAINFTNKEALYNFLSTFSGTHFVTPRSYQGQVEFNF